MYCDMYIVECDSRAQSRDNLQRNENEPRQNVGNVEQNLVAIDSRKRMYRNLPNRVERRLMMVAASIWAGIKQSGCAAPLTALSTRNHFFVFGCISFSVSFPFLASFSFFHTIKESATFTMIRVSRSPAFFLDTIASPSTYPRQSVGQWVSEWVIVSGVMLSHLWALEACSSCPGILAIPVTSWSLWPLPLALWSWPWSWPHTVQSVISSQGSFTLLQCFLGSCHL